jgi:hypothetical protein
MSLIVLCHDKQSGGILVQPVHDARPKFSTDPLNIGAVMKQGVHQRTGIISGSGMNHESGLLVYYYDITVFVYDIDVDGLGGTVNRFRRRYATGDQVTRFHAITRFLRGTVYGNDSLANQITRETSAA